MDSSRPYRSSWNPARASVVAAALGLLCAVRAGAQVDVERFKPAVTSGGVINLEGSAVRHPDDPWALGLWLNYARNPLISVDPQGELGQSFVSGRLGLDLLASFALSRRFELGVGLPLYLLQEGDANPAAAGLGDVRLVPKLQLLSDGPDALGLALAVELRAPTHTGDFSGAERNPSIAPRLIVDHIWRSGIFIGGNLGVLLRQRTDFFNVAAGSELAYAAALGYRIGGVAGSTDVGVELDGALGLSETDSEERALEALGFLKHRLSDEWELAGGVGVGVLEGYGVPTLRGFFGVRFTPTSHDRDHDAVSDAEDACPENAEDRDGNEDWDGCPEEDEDSDHDGVSDLDDDCPFAKETINGITDDDGCPDSGDPRVTYEDGQFVILDTIRFRHGSAELEVSSHSLLNQVALTLKANPEIRRVRVEGHTDDTGPREINMTLSETRARAVRAHLIRRGVDPRRLVVRSYGPDRPLEEGTDADARAKNRRVQFVLEQ